MALTAFPLESNFTGFDEYENPLFDRAVDSQFYRSFWQKYFTNGIFYDPADNFMVRAAGDMRLVVRLGECHIQGLTAAPTDTAELVLNVAPAEAQRDRIDRIVLRADFADERMVVVAIRQNWQVSDTLTRNTNIWELAIADVLVRAGSYSVQQADITDLRLNTDLCGVVTEPIRRTNTAVYFEQIRAEMARIGAEWSNQLGSYHSAVNSINAWYDGVRNEIAKMQNFDFDNLCALYHVTKSDVFSGDVITETVRATNGGTKVAERVSQFMADGSVVCDVNVYDVGGAAIVKHGRTVTRFGADGGAVTTVEGYDDYSLSAALAADLVIDGGAL